jgi:hypothetical protein
VTRPLLLAVLFAIGCGGREVQSATGHEICTFLQGLGVGGPGETCPLPGDQLPPPPSGPGFSEEALHAPGGICAPANTDGPCAACVKTTCCGASAECRATGGGDCEPAGTCVKASCSHACRGAP